MAVVSPCINVCRMDEASGLCVGCFRKIEEIAAWSRCDDAYRRAVLASVEQRRAERSTKSDGLASLAKD